jgi:signal transduction histidine kinase
MMRRIFPTLRSALTYAVAWAALVPPYLIQVGSQGDATIQDALVGALYTVGISAALGVGVVFAARRWPWPSRMSLGFILSHALGAFLYGALWMLGILALLSTTYGSFDEVLRVAEGWWGWQTAFGFLLYWVIAGVTWAAVAAANAKDREQALVQAEALRVKAELSALRGQLDPHFLFNTLHTASVLTRHDPATAALALERLADLLRYVLDAQRGAREDVSLADELAFVDSYLLLEGLRLGERLSVQRDIAPEALGARVPSLSLQPLVENALRYGISERREGGSLSLAAAVDGRTLVLRVSDDGPGAAALHPPRGSGVGLDTLRQRLAAKFGAAASLDVQTAPGAGFHVTVRIPT